jgi:hypothetical protein
MKFKDCRREIAPSCIAPSCMAPGRDLAGLAESTLSRQGVVCGWPFGNHTVAAWSTTWGSLPGHSTGRDMRCDKTVTTTTGTGTWKRSDASGMVARDSSLASWCRLQTDGCSNFGRMDLGDRSMLRHLGTNRRFRMYQKRPRIQVRPSLMWLLPEERSAAEDWSPACTAWGGQPALLPSGTKIRMVPGTVMASSPRASSPWCSSGPHVARSDVGPLRMPERSWPTTPS